MLSIETLVLFKVSLGVLKPTSWQYWCSKVSILDILSRQSRYLDTLKPTLWCIETSRSQLLLTFETPILIKLNTWWRHWRPYPVVMMYPTMGVSSPFLGLVQLSLTDREVKARTIGWPGGSGTSEKKWFSIIIFFFAFLIYSLL